MVNLVCSMFNHCGVLWIFPIGSVHSILCLVFNHASYLSHLDSFTITWYGVHSWSFQLRIALNSSEIATCHRQRELDILLWWARVLPIWLQVLYVRQESCWCMLQCFLLIFGFHFEMDCSEFHWKNTHFMLTVCLKCGSSRVLLQDALYTVYLHYLHEERAVLLWCEIAFRNGSDFYKLCCL